MKPPVLLEQRHYRLDITDAPPAQLNPLVVRIQPPNEINKAVLQFAEAEVDHI